MDASIIILTKNAGEGFATLLTSLLSQKFDGRYEVLIIDSGSTDDTLAVAQGFPTKVTRIKPEEFHHGRTRNLGAELASGRILVYITQDALPLNNEWLRKLADNFNDSKVAMVVGRQIPWQTTKPPEKFFYFYVFPPFKIVVTNAASDYYRDNVFISNVNSAIRKDVWQQFKFSETVLMVEDKEFAKRALFAGWAIVYEPDAVVYHAHDFTLSSLFQRCVEGGIALRQGAEGLPKSRRSFAKRVLDYFSEEFRYLKATGCLKWWPYCIIYDMTRYLGGFLGETGLVRPNRKR
jgi:rhamnosyltransferase